jgi:hypothetical protein
MYFVYNDTYDRAQDNFKAEFLLLISALCSITAEFEAIVHWFNIYEVI